MRATTRPLGAIGAIALAALVLAAPGAAKTKTKTFQNSTPVPIPQAIDNPAPVPNTLGQAFSEVGVTKTGTVKDVNVGVQITTGDTEELVLYVFKGDKYVELSAFNENGSSDDNYGGGTGCSGGMTIFDGGAPSFIYQGSNPFAGSFRPSPVLGMGSDNLAKFNGDKVGGTWKLLVLNADTPPPVETSTIQCVQITAKYKPSK
jgi:hypothetical protein